MAQRCTLYFSTSTCLSRESELKALLEQSRLANERLGITGVMLYAQGSIAQVLEGEEEAVEALFQRIKLDLRHTQVTRVLDQPLSQRLFTQWTMGYETITRQQMADMKTEVPVDEHQHMLALTVPNDHIVLRLVKIFYLGQRCR